MAPSASFDARIDAVGATAPTEARYSGHRAVFALFIMAILMLDAFLGLNWLSILAASVANFALGGVWFMVLFKRQYAAALQLEAPEDGEKPSVLFIAGPFVCGVVTIATTAFLFRLLQISTVGDALILGAVVGAGFVGATTVNIAINPKFPDPFGYSLINVPYFVLGSLMSSLILVSMG